MVGARPEPVVDDPTWTRITGCTHAHLAWLLASSRQHHDDPELRSRRGFTQAARAGGWALDAARLSRIESGRHPISRHTMELYESVLGIATGTFSDLGDFVGPRPVGAESAPVSDPLELHAHLDELFDTIGRGDHGASEWIALAKVLGSGPALYLDQRTWSQTCALLLSEIARSNGLASLRRMSAFTRIARHPMATRHAVRALGEMVVSDDMPLKERAVMTLLHVPDERIGALLLKTSESDDPVVRRAALLVCATWLHEGRFDHDQARRLVANARALWRETPDGSCDDVVIDVLCRAPADLVEPFTVGLPRHQRDQTLGWALRHSMLAVPTTVTRTSVELADRAAERLATHDGEGDAMLERLLTVTLFHTNERQRRHSAHLLSLSPHSDGVGEVLADLALGGDADLARRSADALAHAQLLRAPGSGRVLWRVAELGDSTIATRALVALGHHPDPLDPADEAALSAAAESDTARLRATVNLLGLRRSPMLSEVADSGDSPHRGWAAWWLRHGGRVRV